MNAHIIATRGMLTGKTTCMATDGFLCLVPVKVRPPVAIFPPEMGVRRKERDMKDLQDLAMLLKKILW